MCVQAHKGVKVRGPPAGVSFYHVRAVYQTQITRLRARAPTPCHLDSQSTTHF